MAIRAYLCTVLGIPNSEMATLPYGDNTSVSLLLVDGDNTTVEYYNDNRHLPPALSTFGRQTWWRGSGSGVEDLRYEPLRFPRDDAFTSSATGTRGATCTTRTRASCPSSMPAAPPATRRSTPARSCAS